MNKYVDNNGVEHTYKDGLQTTDPVTVTQIKVNPEMSHEVNTSIHKILYRCNAYETAQAGGLGLWFRVDIPGFDHSAYIPVEPSRLGMPEMGANSLLETSVYVTPIGEPIWVSDTDTDENSLLNP